MRRGRALALVAACLAIAVSSCGGGGDGGGNGTGGNQTPQPTAPPGSTPTPRSPTPRPTVGGTSVCGGSITSAPKVCNLEPHDAGVSGGVRYLTFSFCLSDLEGDITQLCTGVSVNGSSPAITCGPIAPGSATVNACTTTGAIAIGPVGIVRQYTFAFNVGDSAGHISNNASTSFTCCQG